MFKQSVPIFPSAHKKTIQSSQWFTYHRLVNYTDDSFDGNKCTHTHKTHVSTHACILVHIHTVHTDHIIAQINFIVSKVSGEW